MLNCLTVNFVMNVEGFYNILKYLKIGKHATDLFEKVQNAALRDVQCQKAQNSFILH